MKNCNYFLFCYERVSALQNTIKEVFLVVTATCEPLWEAGKLQLIPQSITVMNNLYSGINLYGWKLHFWEWHDRLEKIT